MDQIESEIRRVLQDHQKLSSGLKGEEAKIDALTKEIRVLEERIGKLEGGDIDRLRIQNLVSYQSTLIVRATSRTEVLRVLHEDLLGLFLRRKQMRQLDGIGCSGVDVMPNMSLSSGLSSGNDNNEEFPNDCSRQTSMDIIRMSDDRDNMEEVTMKQAQLPVGLRMLEINMNEDACLTPEDGSEYGDIQYKNNILDSIAMSILDPNANIDNIFKEAIRSSNFPGEDIQDAGSMKMPKKLCRSASRNFGRRLTVDFDEGGNPTGPNAGAFKRSINSYVCHFLPVRFKQIGDVPADDYRLVINILKEKYSFDINRSYTRKKISSCYRQHKYKLLVQVRKDLERDVEPQKPSYVKEEDWYAFVVKTKDEEFDRISKKNKASRSQQSAGNKKGSPSVHKGKLKGPLEDLVDNCISQKVPKPKRGRPKKVSTVVNDNDVVDSMELHVDQQVVQ